MKLYLLSLLFSLHSFTGQSPTFRITNDTTRVRIVFAGDMMGHMPQIEAAWNDSAKTYDYVPVFEYIKSYLDSADIAVVNLETTLAGKPYSGYPQFSSPDQLAQSLKSVGFNLIITANNHCADRGKTGIERTISVLDSFQIPHTGTFRDSADWKKNNPLFVEKNNIKLAFLNYTYGTNGLKVYEPNMVNRIDTTIIRKDIEHCKTKLADFIIVTFHWGNEYERIPSSQQKTIAEFVKQCGAHAIIGSHPHVVQSAEQQFDLIDSSSVFPVIYSLGNFVSNQRDRYKDGGLIVELNLEKSIGTKITSCSYSPVWVYRGTIQGKTDYRLIPPFAFADAIGKFSMSEANQAKCREFYSDTRAYLKNIKETEALK